MNQWVDFKKLRRRLSFEQVLQYYRVEIVRKRNDQHLGPCPLPKHNGNRKSSTFSANLTGGMFQCFGCKARGNHLEFAALMEGINPEDGAALRHLALRLQAQFFPDESADKPEVRRESPTKDGVLPVVINAPLDFELKGLDDRHPYLENRGFLSETVTHFGLGVASRGLLKDRLASPVHDQDGCLIGYAGRGVDDTVVSRDNPRYLFPGSRERLGVRHEFRQSLFLYNDWRMNSSLDDLIVVSGFTSVWWLHQHGYTAVVATMGADCSEEQAKRITSLVKTNGRVWVLPDGDAMGERFAHSVLVKVAPHRFVRWIRLEAGWQPTDLTAEHLEDCFTY